MSLLSKPRTAIVYGLLSKNDNLIRYINCLVTNKTEYYILNQHRFGHNVNGCNPPNIEIRKWIKSLGLQGIDIKILARCNPENRFEVTKYHITQYESVLL